MTGQAVAHWESGRSLPQAVEVPSLAGALGVSICDLYGVEEPHTVVTAEPGSGKTAALVSRLVQALEMNAERIEVNVYGQADAPSAEFVPTKADRETREIVRAWHAMPGPVQREWLEFAAALREEKGEA